MRCLVLLARKACNQKSATFIQLTLNIWWMVYLETVPKSGLKKIPAPIPVNTMTLVICFEKHSINVRRNGIGLADFKC